MLTLVLGALVLLSSPLLCWVYVIILPVLMRKIRLREAVAYPRTLLVSSEQGVLHFESREA